MSTFPVGPTLPELGNALAALLEQADLRELLRKSAQIVGLRGSLALPRQIAGGTPLPSPLLGPQVLVQLVAPADAGEGGMAVALPVEQAAALVDRVLGGPGVGIAAQVGALSDAECGVLAYLAARCCVAGGARLRVADVQCQSAEQLTLRWPNAVCWPLRLSSPAGPAGMDTNELTLDLCLLFPDGSPLPQGGLSLELLVCDELATGVLQPLEPGDLLLSDHWLLTATTRGIEGAVELHVPGCAGRLLAQLQGDRLRASPGRPASAGAELVLGSVCVQLAQLAALCSGAELRLPADWLQQAVLRVAGRPVLGGQLVSYAGGVGLRASELYSTR